MSDLASFHQSKTKGGERRKRKKGNKESKMEDFEESISGLET
jgi:hypothetical protein